MAFSAELEQLPACNQTNSFSLTKLRKTLPSQICCQNWCWVYFQWQGDNVSYCRMAEGVKKYLALPEVSTLR